MSPIVRLTRLVDAVAEPVSLASMKNWLKVENDVDNDAIAELITAARLVVESELSRSLLTTAWRYAIDQAEWCQPVLYPGQRPDRPVIRLPIAPVIAVTAVESVNADGTITTVSPTTYEVLPGSPAYVVLASGSSWWGSDWSARNGIRVTFTAGYGADAASVPKNLILAVRMLATHYHTHRSTQAEIPDAVANLIASSRWVGHA